MSVNEFTDEERRARRRGLAQQAITLAVQSRWDEAVELNRQIVELAPDDAEAYNRLGKALTELADIAGAREAYSNALQADPANLIAQRNLERLNRITDAEAAEMARRSSHKLDPWFFMEETGKTGVTVLQDPAPESVLATLTAGDQVQLEVRENQLVVTAMDGAYLGRVDERLATRLIRLMQAGNQYKAGVVGVDGEEVRIIIRETFQSPQNAGRISFPPQGANLPRPYLRSGIARRASEDEEEELEFDNDLEDEEEEEEEGTGYGFHEANLDEA